MYNTDDTTPQVLVCYQIFLLKTFADLSGDTVLTLFGDTWDTGLIFLLKSLMVDLICTDHSLYICSRSQVAHALAW